MKKNKKILSIEIKVTDPRRWECGELRMLPERKEMERDVSRMAQGIVKSRDRQADVWKGRQLFEKINPFFQFSGIFQRIETGIEDDGDFPENVFRSRAEREIKLRETDAFCLPDVVRGAFPGDSTEHEDFESGIAADPVAPVDASDGFSRGKQPRNGCFAAAVDPDPSECGMGTGFHFEGKTFEIRANNASDENKYIQSARLNGKPLDQAWFTHEDIQNGGVLELEMGARANKAWGVAVPPPSADPMP